MRMFLCNSCFNDFCRNYGLHLKSHASLMDFLRLNQAYCPRVECSEPSLLWTQGNRASTLHSRKMCVLSNRTQLSSQALSCIVLRKSRGTFLSRLYPRFAPLPFHHPLRSLVSLQIRHRLLALNFLAPGLPFSNVLID